MHPCFPVPLTPCDLGSWTTGNPVALDPTATTNREFWRPGASSIWLVTCSWKHSAELRTNLLAFGIVCPVLLTLSACTDKKAVAAEANLNARVIDVLEAPVIVGCLSADQQRVYDRAGAVAEGRFPSDENYLQRRQLIQQLVGDEAFVRETLK